MRSGSTRVFLGDAEAKSDIPSVHHELLSIKDDSEFERMLGLALAAGLVSDRNEANDIRFRRRLYWYDPPKRLVTLPGSGGEPPRVETYLYDTGRTTATYTKPSAQTFWDWWRCDNAGEGTIWPNAVARAACHTRNAVIITAAVASVIGVLFLMDKAAPE